jgi:hypothetical protein
MEPITASPDEVIFENGVDGYSTKVVAKLDPNISYQDDPQKMDLDRSISFGKPSLTPPLKLEQNRFLSQDFECTKQLKE